MRGEEPQLLLLVLAEVVAVARLVVVRGQLLEELLDAVLLARRVDVGDLVVGEGGEVEMNLKDEFMFRRV